MSLTSLPTFPTLNKNHSLQPNLPSTSSKFGTNLVYNDASVTVAATEAVALAYAAVNAARHAVEESENGVVGEKNIGFDDMRRMRRRKRRKNLGCVVEEENIQNNFSREKELVGFLSSIEEAEICLGLKEGARIEVSKHRMTEHEGNSSISRRLAHGNTSLDKVLSNTRESKERLAHEYRGLVASIAARYQGKGLSFQDLTQGEKYGMVGKIAEAKNVLSKRLRRKPTYNEMAEVLNVNVSIVKLVSERSRQPISLDKAVFDQGNLTLKEIMPGPVEMIPEKMVERQLKKQGVVKLLNTLNKREAEILRLYFGLNGETPLSFEEIGKQLKLSRERIRQIHGIALSKLQQTTLVDSLKFYVV
ncbi:RNA polymerase sigma factor sigD, chloroplastic isoform X2 [Cicer arietinum]|uniref:RNA polymerase sigma factor sigD, chloroplastic isoform X2 n=1 Tax=Cicer arietinum TaxID=3827 RepID=UPI003CC6D513